MSRHHTKISRSRWQRIRRAVLDRDGWRCTKCGQPGRLHVHHIRPLERGGGNEDQNLATLVPVLSHSYPPAGPGAGCGSVAHLG